MSFLIKPFKRIYDWFESAIDKYDKPNELEKSANVTNTLKPLDEKLLGTLLTKDEILKYLNDGGQRVDSIDYMFWEDEDIFKKIVENIPNAIELAPRKILGKKEYLLWLLESKKFNAYMISCFHEKIKNDKELAIKAIDRDYYSIEYLGENIRKDSEVLSYLKKKYNYVFENSDMEKEIVMHYLNNAKNDNNHYKKAHCSTRSNISIANFEIERDVTNYIYLPDELKIKGSFVKSVLNSENNLHLIEHVPESLLENKAVFGVLSLKNSEDIKKVIESIRDNITLEESK